MTEKKSTQSSLPPSMQTIVEGSLPFVLLTHDSQGGVAVYDATSPHNITRVGKLQDSDRVAFQEKGYSVPVSIEEALNVLLMQKPPTYISPKPAYEFTAQEVRARETCRQDDQPSPEDLGRLKAECTLPDYQKALHHDKPR